MTDQGIIFGLNLLLWLFLAYRFLDAIARRKLTDGASLHAWSLIILCYLIAVLTVDSIEAQVDLRFNGLPVTLLVRSLLMFVTAYVFYSGMRRVYPYPPRVRQWFLWLNPLVAGVCIALFAWFALTRPLSQVVIAHLIKDIRDAVLIAWILLIFIPVAIHLSRIEQVRPMQLHRLVNLLFFGAFLLECVSSLAWSFTVFFAPTLEPYLSIVERGATYLCLLLILALLLPFRWLMPVFYPERLRLYWRLQRLESVVSQQSSTRLPSGRLSFRLTHPDEIELAIYQKVISILDHYPSLSNPPLQHKIQRVLDMQPQYPELVHELAAIRR